MSVRGPGLVIVALLLGLAGSALVATPSRAADEELRPDNSLESRLLELTSGRRGRITGARIAEEVPGVLSLRVSYTGLEDGELFLSARALDRRRSPLRDVTSKAVPLTGASGEALVRLELDAGDDEPLQQRFVLVQIGGRRGRPECVRVFDYERSWTGRGSGLGPRDPPGAAITVLARPVGESANLPVQKPLVATFRTETQFFKAGDAAPATFTRFRPRVDGTVRDHRTPGVLIRDHRTGSGLTPGAGVGTRGVTPPRPYRPATNVLPCVVVGVPGDVVQADGKGPGTGRISLGEIASDVNVTPDEIFPLHPTIFEDANLLSGFYYYLPRSFHLDWSAEEGYAFRVLYGVSTEANPNSVYISARLTSGLSPADVTLAGKLVERYHRSRYPGRKFGGLKPYPVSGMKPEVMSEAYNIPKEKLVVSTGTDPAGAINLSLVTDPVTKENLQAVLTQGLGLSGTVSMLSAAAGGGAGTSEVQIPLSLRLGERFSFDNAPFTRGTAFRNRSPYPVRLKHLHALVEAAPGRVYSYTLGDATVAPGGSAQIDARDVRPWLDGHALKMWVEYDLVNDPAAHQKVMEALVGGPDKVGASEVVFRTLTPLADTGAALIVVTISSRYLEPKGMVEKVTTLELNKDNETFRLRPVYLVNRRAEEDKPNDPLFKYRLTVVKPDGTTKEAKEWVSTSKMTIFIGSAVIKPILEAN